MDGLPTTTDLDDDAFRHERRRILIVEGKIFVIRSDAIAKKRVMPDELTVKLLGIGVQQQLVGIEAMPLLGCIGSVDTETIKLTGPDAPHIAVVNFIRVFRQSDPGGFPNAVGVKQADLYRLSVF
jgi:hypothetical protein